MASASALTILDAIENLEAVLDVVDLNDLIITEDAHILSLEKNKEKILTAYWTRASDDLQTIEVIRETFRVIYRHLREFYQRVQEGKQAPTVGVNAIMLLVGEAAKRLEGFSQLFKRAISESKEFTALQSFFNDKLLKALYKDFSKRVKVVEGKRTEEESGTYALDSLELAARDTDYELFYLKTPEGRPFYSDALERRIKLACDFEAYKEGFSGDDPLLQIHNWNDKMLQLGAKALLEAVRRPLQEFCKQLPAHRTEESVQLCSHLIMALMLAANPRNLIRQFAYKNCFAYFSDALHFLRKLLTSREYHLHHEAVLPLIEPLCYALFTLHRDHREREQALAKWNKSVAKNGSEALQQSYAALKELLKRHPNGPIFKIVDLLREEPAEEGFDPLLQGNLPEAISHIGIGRKVTLLRLPSPTQQFSTEHAQVIPEFQAFVHACAKKGKRLLLINLQERTSWKEHARARALEELQHLAEFSEALSVVTLAQQTDFFFQRAEYADLDSCDAFLEQMETQLKEEGTGYFFPEEIQKRLFPKLHNLLRHLAHHFFPHKERLTVQERTAFIDLTHLYLIEELVKEVDPTFLSFVSKDGLDRSAVLLGEWHLFLHFLKGDRWDPSTQARFQDALFGATLMVRERILEERSFQRLHALSALLERSPQKGAEF